MFYEKNELYTMEEADVNRINQIQKRQEVDECFAFLAGMGYMSAGTIANVLMSPT